MKILEFLENKKDNSGFGVFETIKVENSLPLRLQLHYSRMSRSLHALGIGSLPEFEQVRKEIFRNDLKNANYLKITATKNGISFETGFRNIPVQKVKLLIIENTFVNSKNPMLLHKTTDYSFFREITNFAETKNCYDGIILNEKGNITQTGKCNIYFETREGEIITPPLTEGLLPGTIRTIMLKRGIVREKIIQAEEINKFKKCFVSNSLIGVIEAEIFF